MKTYSNHVIAWFWRECNAARSRRALPAVSFDEARTVRRAVSHDPIEAAVFAKALAHGVDRWGEPLLTAMSGRAA